MSQPKKKNQNLKKSKERDDHPKTDPASYEEKSEVIDHELAKRKGSWFLTSVAWVDFDDVCQIIRTHVFRKWDHWDQRRPLKPWLNKIISNQLKNILRNYYTNFARPCLNCPFNQSGGAGDEELCAFTATGNQDITCPLFAKWMKTKKHAYDVKVALPLDGKEYLVSRGSCPQSHFMNFEKAADKLKEELKKCINKRQYELFDLLYIQNISEEEVAVKMGYKSTETGRKAGYKQIKNTKKLLKEVVTRIIKEKDLF